MILSPCQRRRSTMVSQVKCVWTWWIYHWLHCIYLTKMGIWVPTRNCNETYHQQTLIWYDMHHIYIYIYNIYIYYVYYECVWKWGIHGIPQKKKKNMAGRWNQDNGNMIKPLDLWNTLIKTDQNPNKYPLVMTKLVCYWKWPFIVDVPIKNGGSSHSYVNLLMTKLVCYWSHGP